MLNTLNHMADREQGKTQILTGGTGWPATPAGQRGMGRNRLRQQELTLKITKSEISLRSNIPGVEKSLGYGNIEAQVSPGVSVVVSLSCVFPGNFTHCFACKGTALCLCFCDCAEQGLVHGCRAQGVIF